MMTDHREVLLARLVLIAVWGFAFIEAMKPSCQELGCLNGGTCVDQDESSTCICVPGFAGHRCERYDPCSKNPCRPNSQCISNNLGRYTCICPPGWTGPNCYDDIDECSIGSPCEHGGTCVNTPGSYSCACQPGYTGPRCEEEILECAPGPCLHGGTCIDGINKYTCVCAAGFEGPNCEYETNECANSPCANGAQCEDLSGSYRCHCLTGWTGSHCTIPVTPCFNSPCLNNGTCENLAAESNGRLQNFRCHCPPGFHGDLCEIDVDDCVNATCLNGGLCIDEPNGWHCVCSSGYSGRFCENIVQPTTISISSPRVTSGSISISTAVRTTATPYREILPFFSPTTLGPSQGRPDACQNFSCLNGGTCIDHNTCKCQPGFTGQRCQIPSDPCFLRPCLNGGRCSTTGQLDSSTGVNYKCTCQPGFAGPRCESNVYDCSGHPCKPYGICVDHINGYSCECLTGTYGAHCEFRRGGGRSNFEKWPSATRMMTNEFDYVPDARQSIDWMRSAARASVTDIGSSWACTNRSCANLARCIPSGFGHVNSTRNAVAVAGVDYTCQCDWAVGRFRGLLCEVDVDECAPSFGPPPCQNGGQCVNTYGSHFCRCPLGFEGRHCEYRLDPCVVAGNRTLCQNGGRCSSNEWGTTCSCPPGFTGPQCEIEINDCAGHPCRNGGTCLDLINSYVCLCPTGFKGRDCEQPKGENFDIFCKPGENCTLQKCENGGVPVLSGGQAVCKCPYGFFGLQCEGQVNFCHMSTKDVQDFEDVEFERSVYSVLSVIHHSERALSADQTKNLLKALYAARLLGSANSDVQDADEPLLTNISVLGPCHSRGTSECLPLIGGFQCHCHLDFTGDLCDTSRDFCLEASLRVRSSYCLNGGRCENRVGVNSTGLALCNCPPGFGGPRCQTYTDHCLLNPCQHGGLCQPRDDYLLPLSPTGSPSSSSYRGYDCICTSGWAGVHCEANISQACELEMNCKNEASCIVREGHSECSCLPGYCGKFCEREGEECQGVVQPSVVRRPPTLVNSQLCLALDCPSKRNNKRCDQECNHFACDFDGHECLFIAPEPLRPSSVLERNENLLDLNVSSLVTVTEEQEQSATPQPATPWVNCSAMSMLGVPCDQMFDDGKCDAACANEGCLFDGWDCERKTNETQCPKSCHSTLSDGFCQPHCNSSVCLFDGGDCLPKPRLPFDSIDYNRTALSGDLVLLVGMSPVQLLEEGYQTPPLQDLLNGLSKLLHLRVVVKRHSLTKKPMIYEVLLNAPLESLILSDPQGLLGTFELINISMGSNTTLLRRTARQAVSSSPPVRGHLTASSQVYMQLDASTCLAKGGSCFQHVDAAAQFVTAAMRHRDYRFLHNVLSVQSTRPSPPAKSDHRSFFEWFDLGWLWSPNWLIYVLLALLALFIVCLLIGVLFTASHYHAQHRIGYHGTQNRYSLSSYVQAISRKRTAKKLQRAKIWFPENGLLDGSKLSTKTSLVGGYGYKTTLSNLSSTGGVRHSPGDRGTGKSNHHMIEQKGCAQSDMMWYLTNEPSNSTEGMRQSSLLLKNAAETSSVSGLTGSDDRNQRFWTTKTFGRDQPKTDPSQDTAVHASRYATPAANVDQRFSRTKTGGSNLPSSSSDSAAVGPPPPTLSESYEGSSSTASTTVGGGSDQEVIVGCEQSNMDRPRITAGVVPSEQKLTPSVEWDFYGVIRQLCSGNGLDDVPAPPVSATTRTNTGCLAEVTKPFGVISDVDFLRQLLHHLSSLDQEQYKSELKTAQTEELREPEGQPQRSLAQISHLQRLLDSRVPETGETLLHVAARMNQAVSVTDLLDYGANPTAVDNAGRTVLLTAVCACAMESIHAIISHPNAGSNPLCYVPSLLTDSTTPLIQSVKLGDVDSFKLILHAMNVLICNLAKGTNPNVPCYSQMPSSSSSCLPTDVQPKEMCTFRSSDAPPSSSNPVHEDNVMSLLDLNIADNSGRTALHWAAVTDQPELVSRLLEAGAAYDVQTIYDETPLALAAREGAFASCRILLSVGANQDLADYLDRTPKNLAELGSHTEVVRLLEAFATLSSMPAMSRGNPYTNRLAVDVNDLYSTRMIAARPGAS
ncbi:unnamed protein product [Calicophoron daubneyi]|uniref:Notch n=1 Tax=Calicophoron daubneyi TaxID=300641 RepID=A0AAV2T2Y2_CALDB